MEEDDIAKSRVGNTLVQETNRWERKAGLVQSPEFARTMYTKADGFENRPSAKTQGTPKSLPFGIRMQFQPNTQNS